MAELTNSIKKDLGITLCREESHKVFVDHNNIERK